MNNNIAAWPKYVTLGTLAAVMGNLAIGVWFLAKLDSRVVVIENYIDQNNQTYAKVIELGVRLDYIAADQQRIAEALRDDAAKHRNGR